MAWIITWKHVYTTALSTSVSRQEDYVAAMLEYLQDPNGTSNEDGKVVHAQEVTLEQAKRFVIAQRWHKLFIGYEWVKGR